MVENYDETCYPMTAGSGVIHKATRLFIRAARIVSGLAVVALAFWPLSKAWDMLSEPFAQSSFLSIIGGLFLGWVGIMLLAGAFAAAFGEAPTS